MLHPVACFYFSVAEIMGLRNKLTELERTLSELKRTSADKMEGTFCLIKILLNVLLG
jgi:hypothetical protein